MSVVTFLQQLQWREPLWLLLAVQPVLLWRLRTLRQHRRLSAYADQQLQPWVIVREQRSWRARLLSRNSAYVLAWLLFAIVAAGPRLPLYTPPEDNHNPLNIMAVMDVSRSMLSNDVRPNRLRRAQLELYDLISRAQGQRMGIVVFAARPHLFVPLTWDFSALRYYLRSLDKLVLPTRGSQLAAALTLAKDQLLAASQPGAIVLFTDGDFAEPDTVAQHDMQALLQQLKQHHLPLYILGVGSSEGGAIPLKDGGWLSDNDRPVISRMDETRLQQLASATGGRYSRVREDDADWHQLYHNGMLQQLPVQKGDDQRLWREYYPWFLFPALLLFFIAIMPYRLHRPAPASMVCVAFAGLLVMNMFSTDKAFASDVTLQRQAFRSYQQHHYNDAAKAFEAIPGYAGRFGEGAVFYRQGNYQAAQQQFSNAVLQADNDQQRADALFNLGNSYFQQGDYRAAAHSFADVLRYQAEHSAARNNLSISLALYQQVMLELGPQDSASRAGRGPRTARAPETLDLIQGLSASIDDTEEAKPPIIPELPHVGKQALQDLIRKGLEHVRVAASGESSAVTIQQRQSLAQARLFMLQLQDQPALLWQSLFEREEGFAAPQSQANEIPGVKPW